MAEKTTIDQNVVAELEQSKNEVLQRIAEKLKSQMNSDCVSTVHTAVHNSHSSGTRGPRGHRSTNTH